MKITFKYFLSAWLYIIFSVAQVHGQSKSALPSEGLEVEVFSTQTTITVSSKSHVFLHLRNTTNQPIKDIFIVLHMPDFFSVEWLSQSEGLSETMAYQIPQISPFADKTVEFNLGIEKQKLFESLTAIFEVRYTWLPEPTKERTAQLYRTLTISGPMEKIDVLGVPLSFAIYIIPGLIALIVFSITFSMFLPLPDVLKDLLKEHRYLIGFLLSVGLLFIFEKIDMYSVRSGIWIDDLFIFVLTGTAIGAIAGFIIGKISQAKLPPNKRFPADEKMKLGALVATYVQQNDSVEAKYYRVTLEDKTIYSALLVKTKVANKVILLPRQYQFKLTGKDKRVQKLYSAYNARTATKVAKLLKQLSEQMIVVDAIKQIEEDGERECAGGGYQPKHIDMKNVVEYVVEYEEYNEQEAKPLLLFDTEKEAPKIVEIRALQENSQVKGKRNNVGKRK